MALLKIKKMKIENPKLEIEEFEVTAGDIIRVKGPSGIGKSSFLKAIVGLKNHTTEEFDINFELTESIRESILYLPQFGLNSELLVCDLAEKILKNKYNENSLKESLEHFELTHILNSQIDNLSGGEKQILSLIFADKLDRSIILCDESFSAIDSQRMVLVNKMLLNWKANCKSIVYISHQKLQIDDELDYEYSFTSLGNHSILEIC